MPRSRFQFTQEHDQYLIDHAGGILGSVDMWLYTSWFEDVVQGFNKWFGTDCSRNEISDRYIRGLEKKRYLKSRHDVKLTKFARSGPTPLPTVSCLEQLLPYRAYKRERVPLDRLGYTAAFDRICLVVPRLSKRQVWHYLLSMRKRGEDKGGLPRLFKTRKRTSTNNVAGTGGVGCR